MKEKQVGAAYDFSGLRKNVAMEFNNRLNIELSPSKLRFKRVGVLRQWKFWGVIIFLSNILFWTFQLIRTSAASHGYELGQQIKRAPSERWAESVAGPPQSSPNGGVRVDFDFKTSSGGMPANSSSDELSPRLLDPRQVAQDLVLTWHTAWSNQDTDMYILSYSRNYAPAGISRQQWIKQRRSMTEGKKFISIQVADIQSTLVEGRLTTSFKMVYSSDSYSSMSEKELTFQLEDGQWRIVQELTKA